MAESKYECFKDVTNDALLKFVDPVRWEIAISIPMDIASPFSLEFLVRIVCVRIDPARQDLRVISQKPTHLNFGN